MVELIKTGHVFLLGIQVLLSCNVVSSKSYEYEKARKLYDKFSPCVGGAIEDETKKVIKYCHCFNSCGKDQTEADSCTVQGLHRRLDLELDVKSPYTAVGGSTSATVSGEVGFNVMKLFDAKIGASGTLEHNWSLSTSRTEFQQVTSEISIGVKPGDELSVFQVVGECRNSDGTVYTVKTPTYVIKGKDGSSDTKTADFSEAEKNLS
ncbi:hypothetical protein AWC38_SpisGene6162 [Stylophora pistillata]|uniref:Uncharacterized protein n=1 Tax=Stylophora pistillata TaxID=50429 RepID=A0A2B4SKS1_STYPI|nr:hypothetical protein AWC38_SpisGene6162 [Stylophora pistillata]